MRSATPVRVGLLSPQSNRNLGDTATFAAAIAAYRRRVPAIELVAVVPEPAESACLLGTSGFPLYGDGHFVAASFASATRAAPEPVLRGRLPALHRVFEFVGSLDAIVFTGGGLLDDFWGGPWSLPFWVFAWTTAARLRGARVLFHAIGYDRLTRPSSRALAIGALRLAHYRAFRDAESLGMARRLGLRGACDVLPDLAFALDWSPPEAASSPAERPFVILNPVSQRMWTHGHDDSYGDYLDAFVSLARTLMEGGYSVKLLSTQDRMDAAALDDVADALAKHRSTGWERLQVTRLEQFMALAHEARLVVSSRLHGLILAMVAGTPVVSVAPMRKMRRLMADVGLHDLNLDAATLSTGALNETVARALADERRLRRHVTEIVGANRRLLNANFDRLIADGLLGERAQREFRRPLPLEARSV